MALGIDITKISRFEKYINDKKFINRIFSDKEIEIINDKKGKRKLELISGKFSAKESVSKALGTGIRGFDLKDIEILNDDLGKPKINLYNNAYELWNKKNLKKLEISISHDGEYVVTIVKEIDDINNFKLDKNINSILKKRIDNSHKGNYGKVALVGGSIGMCGSIFMSSMAALKTGAGLVYTIVPREISQILEIKSLENIVIPMDYKDINENKKFLDKMDSFGIGPGMGKKVNKEYIKFFLSNYNKKIIIDADGLNTISNDLGILRENKNIVLTPHEMEMSRLSKYSIEDIRNNREDISYKFAKEFNVVLVLKGNNTIVTNGKEIYINKTGNPGMATAGSGDILTGILTALTGQNYNLFDAVKLGVYIHGVAGDIAKNKIGEDGMIARDILDNIPLAMKIIKEDL